mmetsp:Transcript_10993/g.12140  ORF Transcript_10993/g.12140 Transcript_10993/m.12140 type:complete len:414 (+) Transcript_10993:256-1497(+)
MRFFLTNCRYIYAVLQLISLVPFKEVFAFNPTILSSTLRTSSNFLSHVSSSLIEQRNKILFSQNLNSDNYIAEHNNDEEKEESLDEEAILRFQGVSKLYHNHPSIKNIQKQKQEHIPNGKIASSTTTTSHKSILSRLQQSTIAVIGIGGVGSWSAEAICRSGIKNIILIDLDDICISNTNRQLHTTTDTISQLKTTTMKERLMDINPNCNVTIIHDFITTENSFTIMEDLKQKYNLDLVIDCIDGHVEKCALIAACCCFDIPIITCGGAAGRIDPSQIICGDLSVSEYDKLLFWTKKKLRKEYRLFPNIEKKKKTRKWRIKAVYSMEHQKTNGNDDDDDDMFRSKCDGASGTACFVTCTYGMIAASQAVTMIVENDFVKPRLIRSSVEYLKRKHEESKAKHNVNDKGIIEELM